MIKIYETNKLKYIKIKEKFYPIYIDKNKNIQCQYNNTILSITPEGKVYEKREITQEKINWHTSDICWEVNFFWDNKRKCNGCKNIFYCKCHLNTEFGDYEGLLAKLNVTEDNIPVQETEKIPEKSA